MHQIDWRYATVLDPAALPLQPPAPGERVDLVFDGIDTIATVWLKQGAKRVEVRATCTARTASTFRGISPVNRST
jgi:hypothetical protein